MANTNRYRWGDQELIVVPVDDTTVVEIGDFVCRVEAADVVADDTLTVNYGCTPSYLVDAGTATQNRDATADKCLGIAMTQSLNGQTANLLVATAGVWELTQKTAAVIHIGDGVEVYASAVNCEDDTIVEGASDMIGVCVEHKTSAVLTGVMVKLLTSLLRTLNG